MPWFHAVAERDHLIQDPSSPEKLVRLGELLCLSPETRVLDLACGKAGPATILAARFGCPVVGVERAPEFVAVARERVAADGLESLVEIVEADASGYPLEPEAWDVALCLGASFVWGGLEGTLEALVPAVRRGGRLAVGEPYWRRWPLPNGIDDEGYVPLRETVARFEAAGLASIGLVDASRDDWDAYVSQRWASLEAWLAEHPDDPDAEAIRAAHEADRERYLDHERELLGWAMFAALKPA